MSWDILITSLLIFCARVVDVSLGTLRYASVVQGRKYAAAMFGFFEVLLWITVVSKVVTHLTSPVYSIFFALGFASGQLVGVTIEQWLGHGARIIRIFTRNGADIAKALRDQSVALSTFKGEGRDGTVDMIFIETPRKHVKKILASAQEVDPKSFILVDTANVVRTAVPPKRP